MSLTTMTSAVARGGDVVQRLPAHAAGQRAVADDGHHVPALAAQRERLGQAVGVGQRGRGVRVLDHGRARSRPGSGSPVRPPRWRSWSKPSCRPVTILCTYAWWPVSNSSRSRGRVEDPVQREGELDHAEVRARGARRCGRPSATRKSRISGGQQRQLLRAQRPQVRRAPDAGRAGRPRPVTAGPRPRSAAARCGDDSPACALMTAPL